jgi:hypothetical protein
MSERKKPKKYSKMGYQQKEMYVKNELQKLGGSGVYYDDGGARGSASTGMFDLEESAQQLQKLASNDYDRRESIKYGKDSGDKRFKNVGNGGFGSMTELVDADRAIAKYGYNELGHTNMSSDNDYAAVSNSLFNKSRDSFGEQFATKDDLTKQDAIKETTVADTKPKELSDRGRAAMESADYSFKPVDRKLGNPNVAYDPNGGIASDKAGAFMNNYKKDIEAGIGDVPGRGMMSLHNRF